MAVNFATLSLRRFFSLGFSKRRWLRTSFRVPSRSIFFFNRRSAFSTGSPFLSLISVKTVSLPSQSAARGLNWRTASPVRVRRRQSSSLPSPVNRQNQTSGVPVQDLGKRATDPVQSHSGGRDGKPDVETRHRKQGFRTALNPRGTAGLRYNWAITRRMSRSTSAGVCVALMS